MGTSFFPLKINLVLFRDDANLSSPALYLSNIDKNSVAVPYNNQGQGSRFCLMKRFLRVPVDSVTTKPETVCGQQNTNTDQNQDSGRGSTERRGETAMKIQKLSIENRPKVYALLQRAFPGSDYETRLVQKLHENNRVLHEWVCIHVNKAIAYIAFSPAYHGKEICGLHLAPMAVAPDFQKQGVGSELLRFALRQAEIKDQPLFVLGAPGYYQRFGFEPCTQPVCPFDTDNAHFLSMHSCVTTGFTVGYEPEFMAAVIPPAAQGKKRHKR